MEEEKTYTIVKKRLGEILVNTGHITEEQLDLALREQERTGGLLGEILCSQGLVTQDIIASALYLQIKRRSFSAELMGLIKAQGKKGLEGLVAELTALCNLNIKEGQFFPQFLSRTLKLLGAEGGNIWIVDGASLRLVAHAGKAGKLLPPGGRDGVVGMLHKTLKEQSPQVVTLGSPSQEFLGIYVPFSSDKPLGVFQVVKRHAFGIEGVNPRELSLLNSLASFIPSYIKNIRAERALKGTKDLDKLLSFDRQLFSTFDRTRIAIQLANFGPHFTRCGRCTVALLEKGKFRVRGISGLKEIDERSAVAQRLVSLLDTVPQDHKGPLVITPSSEELFKAHPGLREAAKGYFETSPFKALYLFSLRDVGESASGGLGVLCVENPDVENLSSREVSLLQWAADQTALALKNARQYHGLIFTGTLEKVSALKKHFFSLPRVGLIAGLSTAFVLSMVFTFVRIGMPVGGACQVLPETRHFCRATIDGVLKEVLVEEGQEVSEGEEVAHLENKDLELRLKEAIADREVIQANMMKVLGDGSAYLTEYQTEALKFQRQEHNIQYLQNQIEKSIILAGEGGTVLTPQPELDRMLGKAVTKGDEILEVGDLSRLLLEVAVPEQEVKFVQVGQEASFLLNTFPEKRFKGEVVSVSEKAEVLEGRNCFIAEVEFPQEVGSFKSGMKGEAKIHGDKESLGYVIFRKTINFFRTRVFF